MDSETFALTISKSAFDAVIFDLDGVVTRTAKVHAAAWKKLFDNYLKQWSKRREQPFQPFDIKADYLRYVDGKPRYEGVRSFLESRGIDLPYGSPGDGPNEETICGLGNKKNQLFQELLEKHGVEVYSSTVTLIRHLRSIPIKTAIVSSSKNCVAVLEAAGISQLFDTKVDGVDAEKLHLEGKPAPDIFLEAAHKLDVHPDRAIVVEDAIAGVQAGSRGNFGCVIGVNRADQGPELKKGGAHVVVAGLAEIGVSSRESVLEESMDALPSALKSMDALRRRVRGKRICIFLDYDGTLTPIVDRPEEAVLSEGMRKTVREMANHCIVAVISGRDLPDVRRLVGINEIFYAGSHGFDIAGPKGRRLESQQGSDFLPVLDSAEQELRKQLDKIAGSLVERKRFSIAVHYRQVAEEVVGDVENAVNQVLQDHSELRKSSGKKVYELQPKIDWHKGKALLWLLEKLKLDGPDVLPLYIGDDITDEDAFKVLRDRGIGIVVRDDSRRSTAAQYALEDPDEVQEFLRALTSTLEGGQ